MQRAIGHVKRGNWKSREWKIGQEWEWELEQEFVQKLQGQRQLRTPGYLHK